MPQLKAALAGMAMTLAPTAALATDTPVGAPLLPVEAFAALPQVSDVSLSPDGEFLAYITPVNGRLHVAMHAVGETDPAKTKLLPPLDQGNTTADVSWIHWGNNDHLLVAYRFTGKTKVAAKATGSLATFDKYQAISYSVLFSIPRSGEVRFIDMTQLTLRERAAGMKTSPAQYKDKVVDYLLDEPNYFLHTVDTDRDGRYEIRKVDLRNGDFEELSPGEPGIQNWMADRRHEARLGWGYLNSSYRMIYRNPEDGKFIDLSDADWRKTETISLLDFTDNPRIAYALETTGETTRRLVTFDLAAGRVVDTIFEPENGTVTGLSHHPVTGDVVGYDYIDDNGSHTHYSEPFFAKMAAQIDRLLPGGTNSLIGSVPDKGLYTILHTSNIDEGTYYLLNLKAKSLSPILQKRSFAPDTMARTHGEWIETRDGLKMEVLVTLPVGAEASNLPMVVMPHGGPQSHSDYGFDYMRQFLANRGYVVLEPNFRGSTGYGRAFKEAGYNEWGRKMQDDVTDATEWAVDKGLADPGRICIAGGSYGGYAALMGTIRAQGLYKCAVSLNGVTDILDMIRNDRNFMGGRNWNKRIVPEGMKPGDISPTDLATQVSAPVMIIHAKDDPRVPYAQGKEMFRKLKGHNKPVEMVTIESGDHFLDTAEARLATLTAMEAFLARHIGGAAAGR